MSHVSIQVGAVRIMGYEKGMVHVEKRRIGCVGREWEEDGWGQLEEEVDGYQQLL